MAVIVRRTAYSVFAARILYEISSQGSEVARYRIRGLRYGLFPSLYGQALGAHC